MKYTVLFNPLSGAAKTTNFEEIFKAKYPDSEVVLSDITKITDYKSFFDGLADD